MNQQPIDRRRHKRIPVDPIIMDSHEFTAINLSESGMQLSCAKELSKGRQIELSLTIEDQTFSLKAEIIWCQKASSVYETGYRVGVKFIEYSVGQQLLIRDIVNHNM